MDPNTIYKFPGENLATLSEVGGKGLSLILGSRAGLPVPPGFILPVNFFEPWLKELKAAAVLSGLAKAEDKELERACESLKREALKLSFTNQQDRELARAMAQFRQKPFFAVRSSSPEEDLEGASFAGGYETILGVISQNIKEAIKKAFASCLDYRVAVYKRENGFDVADPKIAIIIQEQIASETAGVGFSLNPVTNNYDEAVFNANWGLGETVVAGLVTPDAYIADKVLTRIKNRALGKKETSIWLADGGNTEAKQDYQSGQFTLNDSQVLELTNLIIKVEKLYKKPIDIEWAYFQNKLYLLQARPITAYVPLWPDLITAPGQKKRLYFDVTISFEALSGPMSVAGTSLFSSLIKKVGKIFFFRDITRDVDTAIPWIAPGKMYVNLSNVFRMVNREKALDVLGILDTLAAQTIRGTNEREYHSTANILKLLPVGVITKAPGIFLQMTRARRRPESAHRECQQKMLAFREKARALEKEAVSCVLLADKLVDALLRDVVLNELPLFLAGKLALGKMKAAVGKNLAHKFDSFEVALPNNVTTEMGLELFSVAELLPKDLSAAEINAGIIDNTLPPSFLAAWKKFINEYGHRGPGEIDVAAPRYRDNPALLINTLLSMRANNKSDNMREKFARNQEERRKAYKYLLGELKKTGPSRARRFQSEYKTFETFTGYRETHKFYLVLVVDLMRQRVLKNARALHGAGRLQSMNQIFDLTLEEIDAAMEDQSLDLIALAKENRKPIDRLSRVRRMPSVIDSRGFIPHPPAPPVREGESKGTPISPGIVRGRVKVLHSPNEKPFLKGEILVARATDPGWTPLFANAAAVILEVGGVLQHGALVAREYGLPCVAGVENATTLWKDGVLVEVDGSTGIIRTVA